MDDKIRKRKITAAGKRPLAESSTTEEEAVKAPVYQLGPSRGSQSSRQRRVACSDCGAGQCPCRSFGGLAEKAINIVSEHLGYYKVTCPYEKYGCARTVASHGALAHAAACAHAPCACPECAFLGSPTQLVRHLTAHPHDLTATKFRYGKGFPFVVNRPKEPRHDKYLLVAEEDGGVFLLAVGGQGHFQSVGVGVVCLRGNADAGPVYRSSIAMIYGPWERYKIGPCAYYKIKSAVSSCSAPGEFDFNVSTAVCQIPMTGEDEAKELVHLHIRIAR